MPHPATPTPYVFKNCRVPHLHSHLHLNSKMHPYFIALTSHFSHFSPFISQQVSSPKNSVNVERGLVVKFQVVSLFALSVEALNAKRGSKSGFFEAWEKRKWRMRSKKVKGRRTYRLGFAIVVCKFRVSEI